MKENIFTNDNFNSRNLNFGDNYNSYNSNEKSTNNFNSYTLKKNCNSLEKNIKSKRKNNNNEDNSLVNKFKNKSFIENNSSILTHCSDNGNVLKNEKNTISAKLSENNLKIGSIQNKIINNNILTKKENILNKFNTKNSISHSSNKFKNLNPNESITKNKIPDVLINKFIQTDNVCNSIVPNKYRNEKNIKQNSEKTEQNASNFYSDKIKEIKSTFLEIKNDNTITNKNELFKDLQMSLNELLNAPKEIISNNETKSKNDNLIDGQKQLKSSILDIEKKFDSLLKENEILKEMIKSKTEDFDQMKFLLLNLTNMFEKFTNNNNNNNNDENNFTSNTSKYIGKRPNQLNIESKLSNKIMTVTSSNSDFRIIDGDKKLVKIINDNNSNISICSDFSLENLKDFFIQPSHHSNNSNLKQVKCTIKLG